MLSTKLLLCHKCVRFSLQEVCVHWWVSKGVGTIGCDGAVTEVAHDVAAMDGGESGEAIGIFGWESHRGVMNRRRRQVCKR